MKIIDLFCGLGGWADGLIDAGHKVTGYDIVDYSSAYPGKFVQCDLMEYQMFDRADAVVASPPCTDFTKAGLPGSWKPVIKYPPDIQRGLQIFNRTLFLVKLIKPEWFIIENVRAAQKFVGVAREHKGSRYLWGNYPSFNCASAYGKYRLPPSHNRAALRSKIPYSISYALGKALSEIRLSSSTDPRFR